jgi:hypothetical protein
MIFITQSLSLEWFPEVIDYIPLSSFHGLIEILFMLRLFKLQDKVLWYLRAWGVRDVHPLVAESMGQPLMPW